MTMTLAACMDSTPKDVSRDLYYIDTSALLENTPLIKFERNYIRNPSGVFSLYPLHGWICIPNSQCKMASDRFVYIIKRRLHGGLRI